MKSTRPWPSWWSRRYPTAAPASQSVASQTARAPRLPVIEEVIEPGRFLLQRTIRRKYVHRTEPEQAPVIAPLPERLLDVGSQSAGGRPAGVHPG